MSINEIFPKTDSVGILIHHDRTAWLKGGEHKCQMSPRKPCDRTWRIILLGAPGVGKGTQAEMLSERLGTCHLSTGDVFRAAKVCNGSDLSAAMASALVYMNHGDLVPDEIVLDMISERLRCLNCSGGFLLDGFPRTVTQAKALEKLLDSQAIQLMTVLNYELPIEQIVARLSGRRTCVGCKAVYHVISRPPKADGVCDHCGGELIQREDDRPESVQVRMEAYQTSTKPLIDFYKQRGLLVTIAAEGSAEEIYERTWQMALKV